MTAATRRKRREDAWRKQHERLLAQGTIDHYVDAALYDYEYADRTDDVRWYRDVAYEHGTEDYPVLELGAGSGRISCPLANDGHRIIALDRMEAMLDALKLRAQGKRWADKIEPIQADMRALPLKDMSVGLALAPFNGLMHLYTWQDLLSCFKEVQRVLVPGGTFAFDVLLPDLEWLLWDPNERHAVTRFVHPRTGERLIYSTNHRYDPQTQVCHVRIYYDDAPPRGRKFVPPEQPKRIVHLAHRQIFPEEIRMLVASAGLELVSHAGDFSNTPLRVTVETQVVVCKKPEVPGA